MTNEIAQIDRSKLNAAIDFKEQANKAYAKRDYKLDFFAFWQHKFFIF